MEKITVTTYRGLSQVSGSISLPKLFEHMRGEIYRDRVRRIREALTSGDTGKADRMKKQLPYRTITATYSNERLAYSLETYQDIITLDFDDMEVEKIPEYRRLANHCPDTLGNFISPREHGLKIFVYLTGEEPEALRTELNALGTIDLPTLERYHHRMFALAADKYQKLLNTKVDTSGSDLSRGVFVSHDPDIRFLNDYLNLEKIRRDHFQFTMEQEGDIDSIWIQPLLFIPFVENAVKHSFDSEHPSYVHLSFKVEENRLEFRCENTMPAVAVSNKVGGIGLANIQRRLGLLYPDRYELEQIENENRYMVTLCITL